MLDNELLEIIKLKRFNNTWATLQYLNDIGCSDEEILDILSKLYVELDYFKDVAYGRVLGLVISESEDFTQVSEVQWVLFIGMINESNRKLRGVFDTYKRGVFEGKFGKASEKDIENLCEEKYEFRNLSDETIDYLRNIAIKHYGYALL